MVLKAIVGITYCGDETPVSAIRPCEMRVRPSEVLDTSESLHLIISYLLRNEREGFIVIGP